jgi:hypothetical protein
VDAIEHGIGDLFSAFEAWLVSTGATDSVLRLAWAVLTVLWLGHVAVSTRPGRDVDLVGAFGRLIVAGGLLSGIGGINRVILLGFETFREAGAAVLNGLIGQTWTQFLQSTLTPQVGQLAQIVSAWFAYPWVIAAIAAGALLGALLYAAGTAVYLAILLFAHLTLLLAIFLAPLAIALLVAPSTQRWTARWAVVVVRTGLIVFCVRVVHAAALYLAVIVPLRQMADSLPAGSQIGGPLGLASLLGRLAILLSLMLVGTVVGIYTMLRAERLVAQFVDGASFGGAIFTGPMWLRGQLAAAYARAATRVPAANTVPGAGGGIPYNAADFGSPTGGAQDATVLRGGGRR